MPAAVSVLSMPRHLTIAAAQMGPVQKEHTREQVVARLVAMLHQAHAMGAELVVYPELALTTFFPRWFVDDISEADHYYERTMPSAATQLLFDEAKRLGVLSIADALATHGDGGADNAARSAPAPQRFGMGMIRWLALLASIATLVALAAWLAKRSRRRRGAKGGP